MKKKNKILEKEHGFLLLLIIYILMTGNEIEPKYYK
mgnify:FL=1|jgi:hypothetical protein